MPILTEAYFAWAAPQTPGAAAPAPARRMRQAMPADAVLINAKENPLEPNVVRVSVGTPAEMAKFKVAFK
jgi:histidinol-phosphate/aromatic aminotransferase/cobyric acid decarboxylase-like protein